MMNDIYKILAFDKMDDEQKKAFLFLSMRDNHNDEIKGELKDIKSLVEKNKHSFATDFASNVAGNAAFDGFIYIISRLFKRIKP